MDIILPAIEGALIGAGFGFMGYVRNKEQNKSWSWSKVAPIVILSAAGGAILASQNQAITDVSLASVTTLFTTAGLGLSLERVLKLAWEGIKGK